tara:strand:+ start:100 stop:381 length:282 start_codon:yes stop_codon:yes gene_type:complete
MQKLLKAVDKLPASAHLVLVVALAVAAFHVVQDRDVASLAVALLGAAVVTYNNSCLVHGKCVEWAWVMAAVYVFGVVGNAAVRNQLNNNNNNQ